MKRSPGSLVASTLVALLLAAPASLLVAQQPAHASVSVPLQVCNRLALARTAEPVTTGVPLPVSAAITSVEDLNIIDGEGQPVPSQFSITARWGGAPTDGGRPARWLLVTFLADVAPSSTATYTLASGTPNQTSTDLRVDTDTADELVIDTGVATFKINKQKATFFESVVVGSTTVTDSEQNGVTMAEWGGTVARSCDAKPASVTVVEDGPVRMAVKIEGNLGSTVPAQSDYFTYMYFYAGKSYTRVIHTAGNHSPLQLSPDSRWLNYNYYDDGSVTFTEYDIRHSLSSPASPLAYSIPSSTGDLQGQVAGLEVLQDSSGTDYWNRYNDAPYTVEETEYPDGDHPRPNSYQGFKGYRSSNNSTVVDSGDHFGGWMDVSDTQKGITTGVQDFWQNFPKGFRADDSGGTLVGLWPDDPNYHDGYNLRVGDEKSHNLYYYFHTGSGQQARAAEVAQILGDPLWALAPGAWFASSGAVTEFTASGETLEDRLGQYQVGGLDGYQAYDYYNDRTLVEDPEAPWESWHPCVSLAQSAEHPSSLDYFNTYGWAFYGNQPLEEESYSEGRSAFFDTKYDFDFGCWLQFLRTGDWRWKDLAEPMSRHAEQLMMHDTELENGWDPSEYKDCVYGHCMHAERGCENGVRNYNSCTPQFAWGARGSELYYYLTGYPPSYRFASKLAEYMLNIWQFRTLTPGLYEGGGYGESGGVREPASTLNVLVEGWKLTGDDRYQQLAQEVMDLYAPEDQFYIDGAVPGSGDRNIPVGFFSHYLCAMGRYAQVAEDFGLAGAAQTAKDRLVRFVDFMVAHTTFTFDGSFTSHYRWLIDGSDPEDQGEVNNWCLVCSDACAYAYAFTGDSAYLDSARGYFETGVNAPYCNDMKGKLFYTSTKEATNHAVHGSIFMYYARLSEGYPTVSSISPDSGTTGTAVAVTDLAGTNFEAGAEVKLTRGGSSDITATDVAVVSQTRITCELDLSGAAEGAWNVVVVQGGKSGVLTGGFTVAQAEPPGPDPDPDPQPDPDPPPDPEPDPTSNPNATWYLAEGSTDWGFTSLIAIENPNPEPVTARITYMTRSGAQDGADVRLPSSSQTVINPADQVGATDLSTRVQCLEGKTLAVDRRMVWTGKGASASEGHASMGVNAPAREWYLAEGSSDLGFETWLLVQNPGSRDAVCTVTYMVEGSGPRSFEKVVAAGSRATFGMADDIGECDASIKVRSDQPVIAERAMYRFDRREGHDSVGSKSPARDFYLAEGTTGWGFTTYVLVQNPGSGAATVELTCMTKDGARELEPFVMPPESRKTVRLNDLLAGEDCSIKVHSDRPVVAERAMYWPTEAGEACHDSAGIDAPHAVFYLPDGETAGGHETWVLVQNPNSSAVSIEVTYLTTTGKGNVTFKDTVPARARRTYSMSDRLPDGRASTMVRCTSAGKKIVVERAMYWGARTAGTSVMGAFED